MPGRHQACNWRATSPEVPRIKASKSAWTRTSPGTAGSCPYLATAAAFVPQNNLAAWKRWPTTSETKYHLGPLRSPAFCRPVRLPFQPARNLKFPQLSGQMSGQKNRPQILTSALWCMGRYGAMGCVGPRPGTSPSESDSRSADALSTGIFDPCAVPKTRS